MSKFLSFKLILINKSPARPAAPHFYCLVSRVGYKPSWASVNAGKDFQSQSRNFYVENRELPYPRAVLSNLTFGNLNTGHSMSFPLWSSSWQQNVVCRVIPILSLSERSGRFGEYQRGWKEPQKNQTSKEKSQQGFYTWKWFHSLVGAVVLWLMPLMSGDCCLPVHAQPLEWAAGRGRRHIRLEMVIKSGPQIGAGAHQLCTSSPAHHSSILKKITWTRGSGKLLSPCNSESKLLSEWSMNKDWWSSAWIFIRAASH